jgi:hypothetical protein
MRIQRLPASPSRVEVPVGGAPRHEGCRADANDDRASRVPARPRARMFVPQRHFVRPGEFVPRGRGRPGTVPAASRLVPLSSRGCSGVSRDDWLAGL